MRGFSQRCAAALLQMDAPSARAALRGHEQEKPLSTRIRSARAASVSLLGALSRKKPGSGSGKRLYIKREVERTVLTRTNAPTGARPAGPSGTSAGVSASAVDAI